MSYRGANTRERRKIQTLRPREPRIPEMPPAFLETHLWIFLSFFVSLAYNTGTVLSDILSDVLSDNLVRVWAVFGERIVYKMYPIIEQRGGVVRLVLVETGKPRQMRIMIKFMWLVREFAWSLGSCRIRNQEKLVEKKPDARNLYWSLWSGK